MGHQFHRHYSLRCAWIQQDSDLVGIPHSLEFRFMDFRIQWQPCQWNFAWVSLLISGWLNSDCQDFGRINSAEFHIPTEFLASAELFNGILYFLELWLTILCIPQNLIFNGIPFDGIPSPGKFHIPVEKSVINQNSVCIECIQNSVRILNSPT